MSSTSKAEWIQFHSANSVVLTTDDDVDRGDGLHEWKFIYVAPFSPKQYWNAMLQYTYKTDCIYDGPQSFLCGLSYMVFTNLKCAHCGLAYIVHYKSFSKPHIYFLFCENEHLASPLPAVWLM